MMLDGERAADIFALVVTVVGMMASDISTIGDGPSYVAIIDKEPTPASRRSRKPPRP
jgi:hypothetical protein